MVLRKGGMVLTMEGRNHMPGINRVDNTYDPNKGRVRVQGVRLFILSI